LPTLRSSATKCRPCYQLGLLALRLGERGRGIFWCEACRPNSRSSNSALGGGVDLLVVGCASQLSLERHSSPLLTFGTQLVPSLQVYGQLGLSTSQNALRDSHTRKRPSHTLTQDDCRTTALDRTRKWLANWQRPLCGAAATTAFEGGTDDFVRALPMARMTQTRNTQ